MKLDDVKNPQIVDVTGHFSVQRCTFTEGDTCFKQGTRFLIQATVKEKTVCLPVCQECFDALIPQNSTRRIHENE